jgi:hypothetical protein
VQGDTALRQADADQERGTDELAVRGFAHLTRRWYDHGTGRQFIVQDSDSCNGGASCDRALK